MLITPARRVTLAIVVPVAVATIAWSAFSLIASIGSAQFPFSVPMAVPGGRLTADFPAAEVSVVPGGAAKVAGTASYSLVRPHLTVSDGNVRYHCPVPTGTCGLTATLTVPPAATALDVATGGGNLTVAAGITASATLTSSSGDITATGLTGTANLQSGGGNVNASALTATRMTVTSGSGNVTLRFAKAPTSVAVNSGDGNVTIVLPRGDYDFRVNPGDGNVRAPASTPGAPDVITVTSGSGDINVSET